MADVKTPARETHLKIVIGIATAGRRDLLTQTIAHLAGQSRLPDSVFVCPAKPDDVDAAALAAFPVPASAVVGRPGLCAQRNAILAAAGDADLVVFFDDDFLPANDFLAQAERLFRDRPEIVVATGRVLADGIHGPGLELAAGLAILAADHPPQEDSAALVPVHNAYGCNMVFRLEPIRAHQLRFDEAMPLYGWQEDVDFCRRLAPSGEIVAFDRLRGVHLGSKGGRTSGVRLGYSQIANPIYMTRKGTVSVRWALNLMSRNCAANVAGSLRPQGLVDRRGRLKGNLMAAADFVRGRLSPGRILSFK